MYWKIFVKPKGRRKLFFMNRYVEGNIMMNNWAFGSNDTEDMVYYFIAEYYERQKLNIIFEAQLPKKIPSHYKNEWSDIEQEFIQKDLEEFIKIFPKYMMDICAEHNGSRRMSEFPNYKIGHIEYSNRSICIGANGVPLQIAGGDPNDLGEYFMRDFVNGLKGEWNNVCFRGKQVDEE